MPYCYVFRFTDARFDNMPSTRESRLDLLRTMIEQGVLDLRDEFVSRLELEEVGRVPPEPS